MQQRGKTLWELWIICCCFFLQSVICPYWECPTFKTCFTKCNVSRRCRFTSRGTGLALEKCVKPLASDMPPTNSSWECSRDAQEDNQSKSAFSRQSRRWSASNNLRLSEPTLRDTDHVKRTTSCFAELTRRPLRLASAWYRRTKQRASHHVDQHWLIRMGRIEHVLVGRDPETPQRPEHQKSSYVLEINDEQL